MNKNYQISDNCEMKVSSRSSVEDKESIPLSPSSSPQTFFYKFVAACFLLVGTFIYYSTYDMPGSLERIIENTFTISSYKFEYMYTFYAAPGIFVCLLSGFLIDKVLGLFKGSILIITICVVGQAVITAGCFLRVYWLMVAGRLIFGFGNEPITVVLNSYIAALFDKEISLIYGLALSVGRLGSTFTFAFAVPLYTSLVKWKTVSTENVLGVTATPFFGLVIIQFILIVSFGYFYKMYYQFVGKPHKQNQIRFIYVLRFPATYWLIVLTFCLSNTTAMAFVSCSQRVLEIKYNVKLYQANYISTIFNLMMALMPPFLGLVFTKTGREVIAVLIGLSAGVLSQVIMLSTQWNPYIPLTLYSFCIGTVNTCCLSLIALVIEEFQLATGYGILQSLLNLLVSCSQVLVGLLLDVCGVEAVMILFISCFLLGFIFAVMIFILDRRGRGILNLSPSERKMQLELKNGYSTT